MIIGEEIRRRWRRRRRRSMRREERRGEERRGEERRRTRRARKTRTHTLEVVGKHGGTFSYMVEYNHTVSCASRPPPPGI